MARSVPRVRRDRLGAFFGGRMPRSYRYYNCDEAPTFKVGQGVQTEHQLTFEFANMAAHSRIEYLGLAMRDSFERYKVEHEIDVRMDVVWEKEVVHKVLRRLTFPAYYHREKGYWLVGTGKREARILFERLGDADPPIVAEPGSCDLGLVQAALVARGDGHTTGGHFSDLKIDKVKSASIFGTDTVVDSDDWARYSELGEVSAIDARVSPADTSIMITADRLVLVRSARTEAEALHIAERVNDLIDEALASP